MTGYEIYLKVDSIIYQIKDWENSLGWSNTLNDGGKRRNECLKKLEELRSELDYWKHN